MLFVAEVEDNSRLCIMNDEMLRTKTEGCCCDKGSSFGLDHMLRLWIHL